MAATSVTVQSLYQRFCWDLLEDNGLVLGIVTVDQFLDFLQDAILEFCEQVGITKKIFTQTIFLSQAQYPVPDDLLLVQAAFVGGVFIDRVSLEELYNTGEPWPNQVGQPLQWFEDGLPEGYVQLVPIPDFNGTLIAGPDNGVYDTFAPEESNLTTVATAGPTNMRSITIDDDIPDVIPQSFTPYLLYRVHWRAATLDGEAKDLQRAKYCEARWNEGIALGQAIMLEAVNDSR